jgi:hypothetical protein
MSTPIQGAAGQTPLEPASPEPRTTTLPSTVDVQKELTGSQAKKSPSENVIRELAKTNVRIFFFLPFPAGLGMIMGAQLALLGSIVVDGAIALKQTIKGEKQQEDKMFTMSKNLIKYMYVPFFTEARVFWFGKEKSPPAK